MPVPVHASTLPGYWEKKLTRPPASDSQPSSALCKASAKIAGAVSVLCIIHEVRHREIPCVVRTQRHDIITAVLLINRILTLCADPCKSAFVALALSVLGR